MDPQRTESTSLHPLRRADIITYRLWDTEAEHSEMVYVPLEGKYDVSSVPSYP